MREALLRKRCGIPAVLLALLVLAGVATAFVFHNHIFTTTTNEPLYIYKMGDDRDHLDIEFQGESDTVAVGVKNQNANMGYGIFVDATLVKGEVDSITYSSSDGWGRLVSTEKQPDNDVNGDGDTWDAWYNIRPTGAFKIIITVDSADNGVPGELTVELEFHRKAKY